jgi:hypothetical protein
MNLEQKVELLNDIRYKKSNFQENNDFKEFLADCKLYLNPSGYGTRIENRWISDNGYKKINKTLGRGDYKDDNEFVEFKVSYKSNEKYTFLQFRPFQNVDRYDLMMVDYKMNYSIYQIPKNNMIEILQNSNEVCHGTKEHNILNENLEYRITMDSSLISKLNNFLISKTKTELPKNFW